MKIDVIDVSFSKDKAMMYSKLFSNKDPLFDFINSFFNSIDYGYKIVDGKVNYEIFNKESRSGCFAVCYDYEDKVVLNLYGMYRIVINDITFEKII